MQTSGLKRDIYSATAKSSPLTSELNEAIKNRNLKWKKNSFIPKWVDINSVALDQFFTRDEIAQQCYNSLLYRIKKSNLNKDECVFIEPAVGKGAFYNLLPEEKRIGIDIMPMLPNVIENDFLSWKPNQINDKYIVVGNPPFGYRAWLALAFVNYAAQFAEYVGFILPMAFQSDGKGSPKHRVKGLKLIHTEYLPKDSFIDITGKVVKINALWQVWQRGKNSLPIKKECNSWLDLFTVDMRKERLCGQGRLQEADYFLQRTFYNRPPSLVRNFSDVRYVCGYGLIIKRAKQKIVNLLKQTDWIKYSNLAAHNCRHISMYHIQDVLRDAGFVDD